MCRECATISTHCKHSHIHETCSSCFLALGLVYGYAVYQICFSGVIQVHKAEHHSVFYGYVSLPISLASSECLVNI